MTVEAAIDKIKTKDQAIDTGDRIDSEQLTQKIEKVDSFLKGKTYRKLKEMKSKLSPEDYKEFKKQIATLELEFSTEINNLQYKLNDIELDTEKEYKQLIESYQYIFDGMEEDMKQYEHILGDDKEISEDKLIAKVQEFSYTALGINEDTYENGKIKQLIKGVVDTVVIENAELAKQVFDTKGAILVDMVKTIFSWDGIKKIAQGLGESIWGLFSGDVYKTGRSIGELGLVTTGAGAVEMGVKKGAKIALEEGAKIALEKGIKKTGKAMSITGTIGKAPRKAILNILKKGKNGMVDGVKKGAEKIKEGYGKLKDEVGKLNESVLITNDGIEIPLNMKNKMDKDKIIKKKVMDKKRQDQKNSTELKNKKEKEEMEIRMKEIEAEPLVKHFDTKVDIESYMPNFEKGKNLSEEQIIGLKENIKEMVKIEALKGTEKLEAISTLLLKTLYKRDATTGLHSSRMASYIDLFGPNLNLSKKQILELKISALIHDIGKLGTPNSVLNKPGKLLDKEFVVMKGHVSGTEEFLQDILDINEYEGVLKGAYQHHEKVGGGGYPRGIKGGDIHTNAKIMSIIDVFEAMTARRLYKDQISLEKTKNALEKGMKEYRKEGKTILKEFDPSITKKILNIIDNIDINKLKNINPNLITQKEIDIIKLAKENQ